MNEMKRIVWMDFETGGTDPKEHQITQIAAIATDESLNPVGEEFERKVELVEGRWEQEALEIQQYSEERWADAIPIKPAMQDFALWCQPFRSERKSVKGKTFRCCHLAGHNLDFDVEFLRATADRNGLWMPVAAWTGGYLDTLQLAKWYAFLRGEDSASYRLEKLCEEHGIPPFSAHDALIDVKASIALARVLLAKIQGGESWTR